MMTSSRGIAGYSALLTSVAAAIYTIFTSPDHPPVPDHLPTLIVTPAGKPAQVLYTYLVSRLHVATLRLL